MEEVGENQIEKCDFNIKQENNGGPLCTYPRFYFFSLQIKTASEIEQGRDCFEVLKTKAATLCRNVIIDQTNCYDYARERKVRAYRDLGFKVGVAVLQSKDSFLAYKLFSLKALNLSVLICSYIWFDKKIFYINIVRSMSLEKLNYLYVL